MKRIKNIIFDLGGVIMNLDVPQTIEALERIGIHNIVNDTGHHYTDAIFYDFEIGKVSELEFIERLKSISKASPSNEEIISAWNAMILDMPSERINMLSSLKNRYHIYLLSNTNRIHQKKFLGEVNEANNISFNSLFEKAYYSFEIGIRKPDAEVFEFALIDSQLEASETLFVDDSLENLSAAQCLGIKTFHINDDNNIDQLYKTLKH